MVPDVLIQGLVLALGGEARFVCSDVLRILHTVAGGSTDISEALAPSFLSSSSTHFLVWVTPRGVAWVVNHVLIASRCLSHVEHSAVRFGQFATDGFDGVDVSYFSHSCSAISRKNVTGDIGALDASTLSSHPRGARMFPRGDSSLPWEGVKLFRV